MDQLYNGVQHGDHVKADSALYDVNGNDSEFEHQDTLSKSLMSMNLDMGELGATQRTSQYGFNSMRRRPARIRADIPSLVSHADHANIGSGNSDNYYYHHIQTRPRNETNGPIPTYGEGSCIATSNGNRPERRAYIWSGELPPRSYSHPVFSCKIFVGGVPWDISEDALLEAFSPYGPCKVEWPGNEARFTRVMQHRQSSRGKVTGYVYMIFEKDISVKNLLEDCSQEFGSAGEWYFRLKAKRNNTIETRQVQIIPWVVSDASYVDDPSARLDAKKTVFVGALHGMITAHVLFSIMNQLYGKVVFVGIDTDKYKYPIGSGRVTFSSHASYFRAIECAFLEIKTSKFSKRVQIDPFLEESDCMNCRKMPGPYFCRDRLCFRYYCCSCWQQRHAAGTLFGGHRYLTRNAPRTNRDFLDVYNQGNFRP